MTDEASIDTTPEWIAHEAGTYAQNVAAKLVVVVDENNCLHVVANTVEPLGAETIDAVLRIKTTLLAAMHPFTASGAKSTLS